MAKRRESPALRFHDGDFVGSLEKGLLLIEAFEVSQPKLTVAGPEPTRWN